MDNSAEIEIKSIINNLEEELKILIILYYYEDMGISDISEILKMPKGNIKSRLSRVRTKLKDKLNGGLKMDKNNKLDIEINKFLREKDNLEVSVEIIKVIDYILKIMNEKRQSKKINRELRIASIMGLIVITSAPFSVKA